MGDKENGKHANPPAAQDTGPARKPFPKRMRGAAETVLDVHEKAQLLLKGCVLQAVRESMEKGGDAVSGKKYVKGEELDIAAWVKDIAENGLESPNADAILGNIYRILDWNKKGFLELKKQGYDFKPEHIMEEIAVLLRNSAGSIANALIDEIGSTASVYYWPNLQRVVAPAEAVQAAPAPEAEPAMERALGALERAARGLVEEYLRKSGVSPNATDLQRAGMYTLDAAIGPRMGSMVDRLIAVIREKRSEFAGITPQDVQAAFEKACAGLFSHPSRITISETQRSEIQAAVPLKKPKKVQVEVPSPAPGKPAAVEAAKPAAPAKAPPVPGKKAPVAKPVEGMPEIMPKESAAPSLEMIIEWWKEPYDKGLRGKQLADARTEIAWYVLARLNYIEYQQGAVRDWMAKHPDAVLNDQYKEYLSIEEPAILRAWFDECKDNRSKSTLFSIMATLKEISLEEDPKAFAMAWNKTRSALKAIDGQPISEIQKNALKLDAFSGSRAKMTYWEYLTQIVPEDPKTPWDKALEFVYNINATIGELIGPPIPAYAEVLQYCERQERIGKEMEQVERELAGLDAQIANAQGDELRKLVELATSRQKALSQFRSEERRILNEFAKRTLSCRTANFSAELNIEKEDDGRKGAWTGEIIRRAYEIQGSPNKTSTGFIAKADDEIRKRGGFLVWDDEPGKRMADRATEMQEVQAGLASKKLREAASEMAAFLAKPGVSSGAILKLLTEAPGGGHLVRLKKLVPDEERQKLEIIEQKLWIEIWMRELEEVMATGKKVETFVSALFMQGVISQSSNRTTPAGLIAAKLMASLSTTGLKKHTGDEHIVDSKQAQSLFADITEDDILTALESSSGAPSELQQRLQPISEALINPEISPKDITEILDGFSWALIKDEAPLKLQPKLAEFELRLMEVRDAVSVRQRYADRRRNCQLMQSCTGELAAMPLAELKGLADRHTLRESAREPEPREFARGELAMRISAEIENAADLGDMERALVGEFYLGELRSYSARKVGKEYRSSVAADIAERNPGDAELGAHLFQQANKVHASKHASDDQTKRADKIRKAYAQAGVEYLKLFGLSAQDIGDEVSLGGKALAWARQTVESGATGNRRKFADKLLEERKTATQKIMDMKTDIGTRLMQKARAKSESQLKDQLLFEIKQIRMDEAQAQDLDSALSNLRYALSDFLAYNFAWLSEFKTVHLVKPKGTGAAERLKADMRQALLEQGVPPSLIDAMVAAIEAGREAAEADIGSLGNVRVITRGAD